LKRQLQTIRQETKTCAEYLQLAKSFADQLAIVGNPIDNADLISFLIGGLNPSFNPFITSYSLGTCDKSMKFDDFRDELLNHEALLQQQTNVVDSATFALFSNKPAGDRNWQPWNKSSQHVKFSPKSPHHNFSPRQHSFSMAPKTHNFHPRQHSYSPALGHSNSPLQLYRRGPIPTSHPDSNSNLFAHNNSWPPCQICEKTSHTALDCFHRIDYAYQGKHPPPQLAAMVTQTNATIEDQPWYADIGANAHITNNLDNLSTPQPFQANDTVAVGNGAGLLIKNTRFSTLYSSSNSTFHLKQVLHCQSFIYSTFLH
jgi:hypothetical protein